jgi:RNA polymerase sigma factor (sigma-70 family)
MRSRQTPLELFSTFLQFENDHATHWAVETRLRRSMQRCLAQSPKPATASNFWALYWHKVWRVTQAEAAPGTDQACAIPLGHLTAFLQETCYWSAQKTLTTFAAVQYTLPDCFQVAIAKVSKVLQGFNPQQGFSLQNYASAIFSSAIRETLRQRQEVDICSNWALLRKVSQKRLTAALQQAGLAESVTAYVWAWSCFKTLYVPTQAMSTRKLAKPDADTLSAIATLYNRDRPTAPTPAATPELIEKWLNTCAQATRAYLNPNVISINTPKPGQDSGELLDDLPESDHASLLADLIAQEEDRERHDQQAELNRVLDRAIAQLDDQMRSILQLYYAGTHTQQQMATQLGVPQYTISRRLTKAKESLLKQLAIWSQTTLHISLTSDLFQSMSIVLEEWLSTRLKE